MIKKTIKIVVLLFLVIQLYRPERNISNEVYATDFIEVMQPGSDITKLMHTSCYDCHSNNTAYPWYANIAPVSWFMSHHVDEGKEELNFSEWDRFSGKRKNHKLEEMVEMLEEDEMPLSSYLIMHGDAKLNEHQKEMFINWIKGIKKFEE